MAYLGTTQASSLQNPPQCVNPGIGAGARLASTGCPIGLRLWLAGTTDTSTSFFTANYVSDAKNLGVRQGDILMYVHMASTVASSQVLGLGVFGAVTTDGSQLSTWSFLTST